jgi:demethylmenaquinone methyltransferase/2-methoxy-6-polyprenyl-1,4-benzoquinol methylase
MCHRDDADSREGGISMFDTAVVRQRYSKMAGVYEMYATFGKLFGVATDAWRRKAVRALHLQPGNTVLDVGCGTGLNFPVLQEAVGPKGRIVGVDLTPAMLAKAQSKIERHGWHNIELIAADVTQDEVPIGMDGILSAYAMQLIPDHDMVIEKCVQALRSGGRLVILDSKPTSGVLRFLNPLGILLARPLAVSHEGIRRRPWEDMRRYLTDVQVAEHRFGFDYIATGMKEGSTHGN